MAVKGGQTIVHSSAFDMVKSLYKYEELTDDKNEKYYDVLALTGEGVKARSEALEMRAHISPQTYIKMSD